MTEGAFDRCRSTSGQSSGQVDVQASPNARRYLGPALRGGGVCRWGLCLGVPLLTVGMCNSGRDELCAAFGPRTYSCTPISMGPTLVPVWQPGYWRRVIAPFPPLCTVPGTAYGGGGQAIASITCVSEVIWIRPGDPGRALNSTRAVRQSMTG